MKRNTRLAGHTLPNEGRLEGSPPSIHNRAGSTRCSCGTTSPDLPSTRVRKMWHRNHKNDVRSERA